MFNTGSKRSRKAGDIACIFVHAGAGYHSVQNEQHHLAACNDAAKAAMAVMRGGGSAIDAVEIAIKVLEDREITNAGYGSNLALDGVVECDAVVVDHFGRSGGAGAVAQIKNPISLARLLLDHTTQTLSLRRVPPNLLVGQGATNFAYEHNMEVVPHDYLVSPAARDRWRRWKQDLIKAEANKRREDAERYRLSPPPSDYDPASYIQDSVVQENQRTGYTRTLEAGTWNEAQPISPPPSDDREDGQLHEPSSSYANSPLPTSNLNESRGMSEESFDPYGPPGLMSETAQNTFANSSARMTTAGASGSSKYAAHADGGMLTQHRYPSEMDLSDLGEPAHHYMSQESQSPRMSTWNDGSSGSDSTAVLPNRSPSPQAANQQNRQDSVEDAILSPLTLTPEAKRHELPTPNSTTPRCHASNAPPLPRAQISLHDGAHIDADVITDTVGAIAIDMYGNIACGASSGGIGMKHRGRIGPAALVGIGAAVIPVDADDMDRQCVATVTSGTGEHMGTTQAAGVCSERIYHNLRKAPGGHYEEAGDDEAMRGFIEKDFMAHPSVKQSHSSGAIGILSVKKTKDGAYLYFGHNTDSFALASMHSDEMKPVCTMSRSKGNGIIAQGGRAIRYRRR